MILSNSLPCSYDDFILELLPDDFLDKCLLKAAALVDPFKYFVTHILVLFGFVVELVDYLQNVLAVIFRRIMIILTVYLLILSHV